MRKSNSAWPKHKERWLIDARNVADRIVFTLERDLQTVAGAGAVRRKLLDEANQLMARLQESGADDPLSLRLEAVALATRGDLAMSYDDLTQARQQYDEAIAIFERLAQADPGNSQWQRDLSVSYERLGDVERAAGQLSAARTAYEQSLAIAERLAQADPGNAGWKRICCRTMGNYFSCRHKETV